MYTMYYYYMYLYTGKIIGLDSDDGCSGTPAELTGPSGDFGISKSQYKNNAQCGWKIRVEPGKVIKGSEPPVFHI